MSTMNVSLPDALKSFVDDQVSMFHYGSASEYVRELIRRDRERLSLRDLIIEGADSSPTSPVTAEYFADLRHLARDTTP